MRANLNIPQYRSESTYIFDSFFKILTDLMDNLKSSKAFRFVDDINFCIESRKNRRNMLTLLQRASQNFPALPEKDRMEIELFFYRTRLQLNELEPRLTIQLKKSSNFIIRSILLREIRIVITALSKAQEDMAATLYTDNTAMIHADPKMTSELINAWGTDNVDEY